MPLKRFSPYFAHLKAVRLQFVVGLVAGLLAAAASGAGLPLVIEYIVPTVSGEDAPAGLALLATLAIIPSVFAFRALGTFLNAYYMAHAGMHVLECLRLDVFKKLQSLPLAFFQKNNTGDLMARVLGDTHKLQSAIVNVVNSLIKEPATLLSALGVLVYLSFKHENAVFMLIALASVPGCVLPIKYIGKRLLRKAYAAQKQAGLLNDVLNENLQAVREVRAYNLQERESNRFQQACRDFFKFTLKTVKYNKALTPLIEVVASLAIAFSLYLIIGKIEAAAIAAILTALYMSYEPVKKLGAVNNALREAEASLDRLEYILHSDNHVPETKQPQALPLVRGEIEFQNVNFAYEDDQPVLSGINITIQAGESVALVGPSGAGKSTFANLVPRFYDATNGSIQLDGMDLRELNKHDLRQQIALVSQEALLFGDTIANNIRIGNPNAVHASPADNANASQSPAPSSKTPPSSYSTNPPPPSTPKVSTRSSPPSRPSQKAAPSSPLRTVSAPFNTPTASSSLTPVRSLPAANTPNSTIPTTSTAASTTNNPRPPTPPKRMKTIKSITLRALLVALLASSFLTTACSSTSTQNGVQIQKHRSLNPLDYIPYL